MPVVIGMKLKEHNAISLSDFGLKNYGNRLQSYAVLSIMASFGVRGTVAAQVERPSVWRLKDALKMLTPSKVWPRKKRYASFRKFAKRYTPYKVMSLTEMQDVFSQYDVAVIGSDQVWSPTFIGRWSDPSAFFLPKIDSSRKMTLSPSIGLASIPTELEETYAKGLASFNRLSIREDSGAAIIKAVSGKEAVVLADPTMAVPASEWRTLADYSYCPEDGYILTYYLGEGLEAVTALVEEYAKESSLRIVNILDENDKYYDAGPSEFIGLIDRARYVVTDSFHGTVFSMLMHTPFCTIRRTDSIGSEMFSRIETLSKKIGIWDRVIDGTEDALAGEIGDWGGIDVAIAHERDCVLEFVKEELSRIGLV